jgi:hypothetical protein
MSDNSWDDEDPFADSPSGRSLASQRVVRGTSSDHSDDPFREEAPGWARDAENAAAPDGRTSNPPRRRWLVGTVYALVLLVAAGLLGGWLRHAGFDPSIDGTTAPTSETAPTPNPSTTPTPSATYTPTSGPVAGTVAAALAELGVKGRAPRTGYDRDAFGREWADIDRNGCDTRNDILRRDLDPVEIRPGTHGCVAERGSLDDPFSGEQLFFERGSDTSILVQIDHVVSLSNAWQTGAQSWGASRREQFANDPLNLLAVDGPLNSQKSDGDAATWLPPNRTFWCEFVSRQVAVKSKYSLWVTPPERDAMQRVLTRCPEEPLILH